MQTTGRMSDPDMKLLDDNGKVMPRWVWLAAAIALLISIPIVMLYSSYGRQAQGMMACLSVSILVVFTMQYPKYFGRRWLYLYFTLLSTGYFSASLLLPNYLPRTLPTSSVLWPVALVTIGIDAAVLHLFSRLFAGNELRNRNH